MKKTTKALVILLTLVVTLLTISISSLASSNRDELVVDREDLFSTIQEEKLKDMLYEYSKKHECELVIVTTASYGGYDIQGYAENFYDDNGYGYGKDGNGVLLLISQRNRSYYICLTGKATETFAYERLDELEKAIVAPLKQGDYYKAGVEFAKTAHEVIESYNGFYKGDFIGGMIFTVIFSIGAGVITIVLMRRAMNNARPQKNATQYVRNGSFELTLARDMYLYSTIRRTAKPKKSSSGGGGGSRSHSGRGGSF